MNSITSSITILINDKEYSCILNSSQTLKDVLDSLDFFIESYCGGFGKCGKCKVQVKNNRNDSLSDEEKEVLSEEEINEGIRLACKVVPYQGMDIKVKEVEGAKTTLMGIKRQNQCNPPFGLAVDIGTTTVVVSLVEINSKRTLFTISALNPQRKFGADVISRISYAGDDNEKISVMKDLVLACINSLIEECANTLKISKEKIEKVIIAGNTTMINLFRGISVKSMGQYPYNIPDTGLQNISGKDSGLEVSEKAQVYILPSISAFVGADIVSGIISTEFYKNKEKVILIDIGTNGEIAGGNNEKIIVCSSPAGPAFEGAGITFGMPCINGAIKEVYYKDKEFRYNIVGDNGAQGICGSGIIDLAAVLLEAEIIDKSGRILDNNQEFGTKIIYENGRLRFKISENNKDMFFAQEDVRQVQLAKSGIRTGLDLLIKKLGWQNEDIDKIYISGNFGNSINIENAIRIGLISDDLKDKIIPMGNTSIKGCIKCLIDEKIVLDTEKIKKISSDYDIASEKSFQEKFIDNLNFN